MKRTLQAAILLVTLVTGGVTAAGLPDYSIEAIRYANSPGDPVASMVMGAPADETVDSVYVFWLIRSADRIILFDTGFHRPQWFELWTIEDYLRPDDALRLAGVTPQQVTDVIVSHAHWDHMGGIDLFPEATVWIQRDEYMYYTGDAWQANGHSDGIDAEDVQALVRINTEGRVRLVGGDGQEIAPGIKVFTGARHTFASQYLLVEGSEPWVLASDNVYLYRNLDERAASATFVESDHAANIAAQKRMIELAGSGDRVVPGHDALQFERYPSDGRIARIR